MLNLFSTNNPATPVGPAAESPRRVAFFPAAVLACVLVLLTVFLTPARAAVGSAGQTGEGDLAVVDLLAGIPPSFDEAVTAAVLGDRVYVESLGNVPLDEMAGVWSRAFAAAGYDYDRSVLHALKGAGMDEYGMLVRTGGMAYLVPVFAALGQGRADALVTSGWLSRQTVDAALRFAGVLGIHLATLPRPGLLNPPASGVPAQGRIPASPLPGGRAGQSDQRTDLMAGTPSGQPGQSFGHGDVRADDRRHASREAAGGPLRADRDSAALRTPQTAASSTPEAGADSGSSEHPVQNARISPVRASDASDGQGQANEAPNAAEGQSGAKLTVSGTASAKAGQSGAAAGGDLPGDARYGSEMYPAGAGGGAQDGATAGVTVVVTGGAEDPSPDVSRWTTSAPALPSVSTAGDSEEGAGDMAADGEAGAVAPDGPASDGPAAAGMTADGGTSENPAGVAQEGADDTAPGGMARASGVRAGSVSTPASSPSRSSGTNAAGGGRADVLCGTVIDVVPAGDGASRASFMDTEGEYMGDFLFSWEDASCQRLIQEGQVVCFSRTGSGSAPGAPLASSCTEPN